MPKQTSKNRQQFQTLTRSEAPYPMSHQSSSPSSSSRRNKRQRQRLQRQQKQQQQQQEQEQQHYSTPAATYHHQSGQSFVPSSHLQQLTLNNPNLGELHHHPNNNGGAGSSTAVGSQSLDLELTTDGLTVFKQTFQFQDLNIDYTDRQNPKLRLSTPKLAPTRPTTRHNRHHHHHHHHHRHRQQQKVSPHRKTRRTEPVNTSSPFPPPGEAQGTTSLDFSVPMTTTTSEPPAYATRTINANHDGGAGGGGNITGEKEEENKMKMMITGTPPQFMDDAEYTNFIAASINDIFGPDPPPSSSSHSVPGFETMMKVLKPELMEPEPEPEPSMSLPPSLATSAAFLPIFTPTVPLFPNPDQLFNDDALWPSTTGPPPPPPTPTSTSGQYQNLSTLPSPFIDFAPPSFPAPTPTFGPDPDSDSTPTTTSSPSSFPVPAPAPAESMRSGSRTPTSPIRDESTVTILPPKPSSSSTPFSSSSSTPRSSSSLSSSSYFSSDSSSAALCTAPACPIPIPHPQGLYLHNNELPRTCGTCFGRSNPPDEIWQAWESGNGRDAVGGFVRAHFF